MVFASRTSAQGWLDYELEIAPGFTVFRANSFDVCLGTPEGALIICPHDYPGLVGPLVEYAVTSESIATRHEGVRPNERNPAMSDGDPDKEFFFSVRRGDQSISGPFTRSEWEKSGLPPLSSFDWKHPQNPNFSYRPRSELIKHSIVVRWDCRNSKQKTEEVYRMIEVGPGS